MTKRLYYDDAYLTGFRARLVEQMPYLDQYIAVLDQTAFYPTSGGQPFDRGLLGGVKVMDVLVRAEDDTVLHVLESPLPDETVEIQGQIDWDRRFDHMQQHTGQHILSQAFLQVAQAETVSFHLGDESATIDLFAPRRLLEADLEEAEKVSNKIVWEDRLVTVQVVDPAETSQVPLRKPPAVSGDVRVVQVTGFDWSACGGTHVARTGEVGMIKIIKSENRGEESRVEFRCGWRALHDYAAKNRMVNRIAAGFNVGHWELDQAIERLAAETKELRASLRRADRELARYKAGELRATAPRIHGVRLAVHKLTDESLDLRELSRQLVSEPGVVALLGTGDRKAQFCFARSPDLEIDMVSLVRSVAEMLGSRGGGGRPDFAQGGGPVADEEQLNAVLEWAAQKVREQLEKI